MKYTYGRNGTPTSDSLIYSIASIYNAHGCVLASSGMNAISTALMSVLMAGDHILLPDCVYGSTRRFVIEEFPRLNIKYDFYNPRNLVELENLINESTKVIYLESPGTYTFEIIDINKVKPCPTVSLSISIPPRPMLSKPWLLCRRPPASRSRHLPPTE